MSVAVQMALKGLSFREARFNQRRTLESSLRCYADEINMLLKDFKVWLTVPGFPEEELIDPYVLWETYRTSSSFVQLLASSLLGDALVYCPEHRHTEMALTRLLKQMKIEIWRLLQASNHHPDFYNSTTTPLPPATLFAGRSIS